MKLSKRVGFDGEPNFFQRTVAAQLHLLGVILVFLGSLFLLPRAYEAGLAEFFCSLSFILGGLLVFFVSSFYHFLEEGFELSPKLELTLENLDHISIYFFIAGTYSPLLMTAVSDPWRGILLIGIWVLALLGMLYTVFKPKLPKLLQHRAIYTLAFVLMGWTILIRIGEVTANLSSAGLNFLLLGGAAYTVGAIIYALEKPSFFKGIFGFHELWHLMVLFGFSAHFFMIFSLY